MYDYPVKKGDYLTIIYRQNKKTGENQQTFPGYIKKDYSSKNDENSYFTIPNSDCLINSIICSISALIGT